MKLSVLEEGTIGTRSRRFVEFVRAQTRRIPRPLPTETPSASTNGTPSHENIDQFCTRLSERVKGLTAIGEFSGLARLQASDASFRPFLRKIVEAASRTSHPDRHELLAEWVIRGALHRIDSANKCPEQVCAAIQTLASRHFRMLGLLAILTAIRPLEPIRIDSRKEYRARWVQWWNVPLETLCTEDLTGTYRQDTAALLAAGCVARAPDRWPEGDLSTLLQLRSAPQQFAVSNEWITGSAWSKTLSVLWRGPISKIFLTSAGLTIGTLYLDRFLGISSRLQTCTTLAESDPETLPGVIVPFPKWSGT